MNSKINSITSLRFFCALYVYLFHIEIRQPFCPEILKNIILNGYAGMDFFFILSGFVLSIRYWDDNVQYIQFIVSRLSRIYPAFLVAFCLSIPLFVHLENIKIFLNIFSNIFLMQAWFPNLFSVGINGGTWSLSVEMFFYSLFPLILSYLSKVNLTSMKLISLMIILYLCSVAPGIYEHYFPVDKLNTNTFYYSSPPYRLSEFVLGICLALIIRRKLINPSTNVLALSFVVFLYFASIYNGMATRNYILINIVAVPLTCITILYSAIRSPAFMEKKYIIYLGEISYGFYMFQFIFIAYLFPKLKDFINVYALTVFGFIITVICASISFHLIEIPTRSLIRNYFKK